MSETPKRPPEHAVDGLSLGTWIGEWIAYADHLEREVHQYREAAMQESSHRAATETERARLEARLETRVEHPAEEPDASCRHHQRKCSECGIYPADEPSPICVGCDAYKEHTDVRA